ncbi:MAG TPA: hypothetical protein VIM58_06235 [Candidatus Methylacidiphilales bacterium]
MIPVLAFTIAVGNEAMRQARLLRTTFKAVHPEIPFLVVDAALYARVARQPGVAQPGEIMAMRAWVGRHLSAFATRVAYLDADVLVLSPLDPLLGPGGPAVRLTRDIAAAGGEGKPPPVNAGVLSAADPLFWIAWTRLIEERLLPLIGNFFDQFTLRLMAWSKEGPLCCTLLPEVEAGDFLNIAAREAPGEWGRDGAFLTKGTARVRLWHWAGHWIKPGLDSLPPPAQELARERIAQGKKNEAGTAAADAALLDGLFAPEKLEPFFAARTAEIAASRPQPLIGMLPPVDAGGKPIPHPDDLWGSDLPAAWEAVRPAPPGFHRRLLPQAPRWLYARSEARLHAPDVERYAKPFWAGEALG